MASATGIPEQPPTEQEPLLGRPGDASQREGKPIAFNLFIGTAILAQAGIWILAAVVWAGIFTNDLILFSAHPLLNMAGVFLVVQSILILQPTHTKSQKTTGTQIHAILNGFVLLSLIAGLVIIEYNKISHNGTHFVSPHAILGLITYIFFTIQTLFGFLQYYTPGVFGGEFKAKKLYKFHRISGYLLLILSLATISAATQTDFNLTTLHIKLWAVIVPSILVLVGIIPRIKKQKFGF